VSHFEIERKFLVLNEDWRALATSAIPMRQGYLNNEKRCSVRVRISGDEAHLNIKGATIGAKRLEFEYPIPLEQASIMLDSLSAGPLIEKVRYLIPQGHLTWEIDVFSGDNAGLVVAEIELSDADEAFDIPTWIGEEVTHDTRYYNTRLSREPYSTWNAPA
jgi:adenylate cyclase